MQVGISNIDGSKSTVVLQLLSSEFQVVVGLWTFNDKHLQLTDVYAT